MVLSVRVLGEQSLSWHGNTTETLLSFLCAIEELDSEAEARATNYSGHGIYKDGREKEGYIEILSSGLGWDGCCRRLLIFTIGLRFINAAVNPQ